MPGIIVRLKRLVEANVRALLERAANPEVTLLEFATEVEHAYGEVKAEMVDASNLAARIESQLTDAAARENEWAAKAAVAVDRGDDELALEALKRKAQAGTVAGALRTELQEQLALAASLSQTLGDLGRKLAETQAQRDALLRGMDRAAAAERVSQVLSGNALWTGDAAAERVADEILERTARLEAYQEWRAATLENEFGRLDAAAGPEAELARMKKKQRDGGQ
jgi:phage shock protein A